MGKTRYNPLTGQNEPMEDNRNTENAAVENATAATVESGNVNDNPPSGADTTATTPQTAPSVKGAGTVSGQLEEKGRAVLGRMRETNENRRESSSRTNEETKTRLQGVHSDVTARENKALADIEAANKVQENARADSLKQIQEDMNAAIRENQILTKADNRASMWLAATEAVSSLANLIGVGAFNSSNMRIPSYSKDWMKQADRHKRDRQTRIDGLRDRLRAAERELADMKASGAKSVAQLSATLAGNQGSREIGIINTDDRNRRATDKEYYDGKDAIDRAELGLAGQVAGARQQEDNVRRTADYRGESLKLQAAAHGFTKNSSGEYSYTGLPSSGDKNKVRLVLPAYGKNAERVISVDRETLANALWQNRSDLGLDAKEAEKIFKQLQGGMLDSEEALNVLKGYINDSPEMNRKLRKLAGVEWERDGNSVANTPEDDPGTGSNMNTGGNNFSFIWN